MSYYNGPKIVTNGMVMCLDLGSSKCYPKSGTSLNDLSQMGGTVSTGGSPTFSSNNMGYMTFDGSTQYINMSRSDLNAGTWAYSNVTAMAWVNIDNTSTTGDNNIMTVESSWEYRWNNQNNGTSVLYYASNPWAWYGPSSAVTNGVWQMLTFRHDASNGDLFCNDQRIYTQAISGTIGGGSGTYPNLTVMSRLSGGLSWAKGNMAMAIVYNRALSNSEIAQNYNATKKRFGL